MDIVDLATMRRSLSTACCGRHRRLRHSA
jgi:hypothetical protein